MHILDRCGNKIKIDDFVIYTRSDETTLLCKVASLDNITGTCRLIHLEDLAEQWREYFTWPVSRFNIKFATTEEIVLWRLEH